MIHVFYPPTLVYFSFFKYFFLSSFFFWPHEDFTSKKNISSPYQAPRVWPKWSRTVQAFFQAGFCGGLFHMFIESFRSDCCDQKASMCSRCTAPGHHNASRGGPVPIRGILRSLLFSCLRHRLGFSLGSPPSGSHGVSVTSYQADPEVLPPLNAAFVP